jgi:KaiC/GvpD/RAD55 family RecA-like ATPase
MSTSVASVAGPSEYIRISKTLADRNYKLYPRDSFKIEDIITTAQNTDYYQSLYLYNDHHYNKWKETGSVAGIIDVKTNRLIMDFDAKDIEHARRDTKIAVERLKVAGVNESAIQVYFSGNKGFHIQVDLIERLDRKDFEAIVFGMCGDLKTIDRQIKDQQRLIRVPFTKNPNSGLYKIPLTIKDLDTSILMIKDKARSLREEDWDLFSTWQNNPQPLTEGLKKFKKTETEKLIQVRSFEEPLDLSRKPNWLSPARFAIQEGFFREGNRNTAFMVIASTYKANGFSKEVALGALLGVAKLQASRTGGEPYDEFALENNIIGTVYSPNWRGGVYNEKENEFIQQIVKENNLDPELEKTTLITVDEALRSVMNDAHNYKEKIIQTGFKLIDDNVMLRRGWMVGLLGAPGSGKSTMSLSFAKNTSARGKVCLFESLDMDHKSLFYRLLQQETGHSLGRLMDEFDTNNISKDLKKAIDRVHSDFRNILINDVTGATVESIETDVAKTKAKYGADLELVVVDYLEKVRSPYSDPTSASAFVAGRLSDIAKKYEVCLVLLLQPRKAAGDPRYPLDTYEHIKGSGVIQQDSRVIMTVWRPGYDPLKGSSNDKFMSLAVVKANLGPQVQVDFGWDGLSGQIYDLSSSQKTDLSNLRRQIEYEKSKEKKSYNNQY